MNFIDREKELETLNKEYKKDNSFVVLYGRRRVGKTTLIKEFIKDKKAFYFFADKQNENLQIERFKNQISEHFKDKFLKKYFIFKIILTVILFYIHFINIFNKYFK